MQKQLTQEDIDQNPLLSGLQVGSLLSVTDPETNSTEEDGGDPIPKDPIKG